MTSILARKMLHLVISQHSINTKNNIEGMKMQRTTQLYFLFENQYKIISSNVLRIYFQLVTSHFLMRFVWLQLC